MSEEKEKTCAQRVAGELESRISDLEKLWAAEQKGDENGVEDLGTFNEYGLCFDYVAPHTFTDQWHGYFRYQLSYGGPSDEFRFYTDENLNPTDIEYWFLDWFDGASIDLTGENYKLMEEIFDYFKECGTVQQLLDDARKEGFEETDDDDEDEEPEEDEEAEGHKDG